MLIGFEQIFLVLAVPCYFVTFPFRLWFCKDNDTPSKSWMIKVNNCGFPILVNNFQIIILVFGKNNKLSDAAKISVQVSGNILLIILKGI